MLRIQATSVAQEHKKLILFSWYIQTVEQACVVNTRTSRRSMNIVGYSGKDEQDNEAQLLQKAELISPATKDKPGDSGHQRRAETEAVTSLLLEPYYNSRLVTSMVQQAPQQRNVFTSKLKNQHHKRTMKTDILEREQSDDSQLCK